MDNHWLEIGYWLYFLFGTCNAVYRSEKKRWWFANSIMGFRLMWFKYRDKSVFKSINDQSNSRNDFDWQSFIVYHTYFIHIISQIKYWTSNTKYVQICSVYSQWAECYEFQFGKCPFGRIENKELCFLFRCNTYQSINLTWRVDTLTHFPHSRGITVNTIRLKHFPTLRSFFPFLFFLFTNDRTWIWDEMEMENGKYIVCSLHAIQNCLIWLSVWTFGQFGQSLFKGQTFEMYKHSNAIRHCQKVSLFMNQIM